MSQASSEAPEAPEASETQAINPADCFKILLATDIHLGYKEKDTVIGIGHVACNDMIAQYLILNLRNPKNVF